MTTITYNGNSTLILSKFGNDKIKVEYIDVNKIKYEGESDLDDYVEYNIKTQDEVINFLKINKQKIKIEKTGNDQEIKINVEKKNIIYFKAKNR